MSLPYHLDSDETIEKTIRHHPMSLLPGFVGAGAMLLAAIGVLFIPVILGPLSFGNSGLAAGLTTIIALVLVVLSIAVAAASWYQYQHNYMVLTSKNLIIIQQRGLFDQSVSQTGLSYIEDVKALKKGIGATLFNYGTVLVATASDNETEFLYAPDAPHLADEILSAQDRSTTSAKRE